MFFYIFEKTLVMNWKLLLALLLLFVFGMNAVNDLPGGGYTKMSFLVADFLIAAVLISRYAPGKYFLHGFLLGVLIVLAGVVQVFFEHHFVNPYWPLIACLIGAIIGTLSFIISKLMARRIAGNS
jgi:hypothetical protein